MKKVLSLVIAVIMIVMAFPLTAWAASGVQSGSATDTQITSKVCSIWYIKNGVETKQADYDSVDAAFEGLRERYVGPLADTTIVDTNGNGLSDELYEAAGSPVIKLNGNFQGAYARPNWATNNGSNQIAYDMNKVITIVIDGAKSETENYTITYGTSSSAYDTQTFNYLAYYNLTIKNTNMIINRGASTIDNNFLWQGNSGDGGTPGTSYTIFENCFIQQNSTLSNSGSGGLFKMNGDAKANADSTGDGIYDDPTATDKFNLIFRDTSVESGTGVPLQVHWGADANIELYNSTFTAIGTAGTGNNNDAVLKFYEAGDGYIYLDSTSKLISKRASGSATVALIRINSSQHYPVNIVLEKGAELRMENTGALTTRTYIASNGKYDTITDKGALYYASKADAVAGVTLTNKLSNWTVGAGVPIDTSSSVVYTNASATSAVSIFATAPWVNIQDDATGEVPAGLEYTDTINEAFDWVYSQDNSADYTIYLNNDVTTGEYMNPESYAYNDVKTVKINGNGHTLTSTNTTATFYGIGLYNLKLTDLNMLVSAASSLDWSPRMTPSDAYSNYIATGSNPVVDTFAEFTNVTHAPMEGKTAGNLKLKGGNSGTLNTGTYGIKMVDSVFTCTTADTMFMMNDKGNLDLDVIGTTINYIGGASNNDGNNYIFALNGAAVDINVENSENNISVIHSNSQSTRVTSGIFYNGTSSNVNVTLGEGVELRLNANDYKTTAKFFGAEKTTTTITDNGAKWTVCKALLDNGASVTLPTTMFTGSVNDHVWYANGTITNIPYMNSTVTADVAFTHVEYSDDIQTEYENVAYIKTSDGTTTYYSSIALAMNALDSLYSAVTTEGLTDEALWQAAGSPVIYLYKDITITSETYPSWVTTSYDASRVRTVVIKGEKVDGSNTSITSTVSGAAFSYNAYYNITLENIDLTCTNGFALFWRGYNNGNKSERATTNLINCNISATGTSGEGLVFKVTGNQNQTKTENFIINLTGTQVLAKAGVNAVFLFHHGAAGELNIDGNSSIHHVQNKSADGGDTMFMLGTNRKFTVNIADGAELSAEVQVVKTTGAYANTYAIFRNENSNTYASADGIKNVININSGAKLSISADDAYSGRCLFVDDNLNNATTKSVITLDDGATFALDAKAASNGFALIESSVEYTNPTNSDMILFGTNVTTADGTTLYGETVAAGGVNEAVTDIVPVYIDKTGFGIVGGASLRTVTTENGIRFTSFISDELKEYIDGLGGSYGTVIAPGTSKANDPATNSSHLDIACSGNFQTDSEYGDNVFHAAVIMPGTVSPEKAYALSLVARAYIEVTFPDGTTSRYYTDLVDDNVRSMTVIAEKLVDLDAATYYDNDVVRTIVATMNPFKYVQYLLGANTILDSTTTCKEMIYTGLTDGDYGTTVIENLTASGYAVIPTSQIEGAKFTTTILQNGTSLITIYWDATNGELRIMHESTANNATEVLSSNEATGTGTIEVAQVGIERGTYSVAEDGTITYAETDNPLNGMCYVIKLSDGSAIIIDGGFETAECAANLYSTLKTLGIATDDSGKYLITAWIFTHGHGDHIATFRYFAANYTDEVDIAYIVHNMPNSAAVASVDGNITTFDSAAATGFPNAKRVNPHAGLQYYFGNATVEILYAPEMLYTVGTPLDYYNNTSLIFKVTANGGSVLFMGDAGEKAAEKILNVYDSSAFASNILQISHHGLYTEASNGHTWTNIKTLYDAVGASYAFLPLHSQYDGLDSTGAQVTRNGRYTVMVSWGITNGYQMSYVMNENDTNTAFGSRWDTSDVLTQDQFEEFIAKGQVTSNNNTLPTTVTVSTVYGYDGVNKVTNENGMVTYLGSNDTTPMVTIFTVGNDTATLTTNADFYEWSGTTNPYATT